MARGAKALITPSVLAWARESSGFGLEESARTAGVKPEKLAAWEDGSDRPTIRQLRLLANKYKRPIAVFYLPEPPEADPVGDLLDELERHVREARRAVDEIVASATVGSEGQA